MKANPSKFQTIIFKHRSNEAICELNISNDTIKPVSCVKLLGVTLDDKLCFDDHISRLCTRAARQTNALRRILKYVPLDCRINIYKAFIASNFNYCKTVWHFCSNRSAYKIEKVNKKALRVTLNDYESPYVTLLKNVSRPTLYAGRLKSIVLETYKCVKTHNPAYLNDLFCPSPAPYETHGGLKLVQPKVKTTGFGLNTFCYQGAKIWNAVPENVKNAECISTCKELIAQWSGPECTCGSCLLRNTYVIWLSISIVVLYRLLLFCSLSNKEFCLIITSM